MNTGFEYQDRLDNAVADMRIADDDSSSVVALDDESPKDRVRERGLEQAALEAHTRPSAKALGKRRAIPKDNADGMFPKFLLSRLPQC